MRSLLIVTFFVLGLSRVTMATEKRCGWIQNPSPANYFLIDADGDWILAQQGKEIDNGFEDLEFPTDPEYTKENDARKTDYCACLGVIVNEESGVVEKIEDDEFLVISRCEDDPAIN